MKREKKFLNNENIIIYVGTTIFFILAISVGIVMYKVTKDNSNNADQIGDSSANVIEDASINIGKTVEEQEKDIEENKKEEKHDEEEIEEIEGIETDVVKTSDNEANDNIEKETETNEEKKPIIFTNPTEGEIIAEFAQENLIYSETLKEWITHTGIDIKADKTSVIKASADGVITSIINDPRYGLTIVMTHDDGYETVYSNLLTAEFVVEGEEVEQGQTIGTAGNTASFESGMESHLHFEILKDGEYLNPSIYLK